MNTIYLATPGDTSNPIVVGKNNEKIFFNNNTGGDVTAFTLPTCLKGNPNAPVPIPDLDTIGFFTLQGNADTDYDFSFTDSSLPQAARSGTIRIS